MKKEGRDESKRKKGRASKRVKEEREWRLWCSLNGAFFFALFCWSQGYI